MDSIFSLEKAGQDLFNDQKKFDFALRNVLFFRWQYLRQLDHKVPNINFLKARITLIMLNSWDMEALDIERYNSEFLTLPQLPLIPTT